MYQLSASHMADIFVKILNTDAILENVFVLARLFEELKYSPHFRNINAVTTDDVSALIDTCVALATLFQ